ncbi:hypothetical protein [Mycolicibacterium iranicum]|uniref:Transmembrane protein n=1 Tax=Mycolicibacterium iranicum TaxID=912594 RepID=A0A1X1X345_MYCIR|nr:hypothetical protein [Mycolicibacterium iranicum]ORV93282.1 hypothetical protein AWC12_00025 [Mycolicibacterium iranicum]
MGRTAAVIWHASFSIAAGVLYFLFVLPRTLELLGDTSHTLGTALRIATGALIGLAALPVVFTLLRTRAPEFGTPKLALNLRTGSIALHVLAGALIIAAAISEIWLSLDTAGQWLFGIYGGAAATALLGVFAFYLAFVAEMQPPPPKPLKVKERTSRRSRSADTAEDEAAEEAVDETSDSDDADANSSADEVESADDGVKVVSDENDAEAAIDEPALDESTAGEPEADGRLQNRRPTGKGTVLGRRKRTRGGVAVED